MILRHISLVLLIVWKTEALIFLQPDHPACSRVSTTLTCDFKEYLENIELRDVDISLVNYKFVVISIHNAKHVAITSPQCFDLTFKNIGTVHFINDNGCAKRGYSLSLTHSVASRIPRKLSRLTLVSSHVDTLVCDIGLQRLLLSHSSVGTFNVPWPVGGYAQLTIEHTKIDQFIKLDLQEKVNLSLVNVSITNFLLEAIGVGNGASLKIFDSVIEKAATPTIVLKPGSKLTVTNLIGSLPTASKSPDKEDIEGKRPPGVPNKKPQSPDEETLQPELLGMEDCLCPSPARWLIPTLFAIGEAIFIAYSYKTNKRPTLLKNASHHDSETGNDNFNINVQGSYDTYNPYSAGLQFPHSATPVRRR